MRKARYARTKIELARALGISYYTLVRSYWHKPGRPRDHSPGNERYDIQGYKDWISDIKFAHNFGSGQNGNGNGYHMSEREKALLKKREIEIEREQFNLDRERGNYWLKVEGKSTIQRYANALWREIEKVFAHELPPREDGMSAIEIAKLNSERIRDIRGGVGKILASA